MTSTLRLDPVLNLKAASPLKASLTEHRGVSVQLDASDVERLGGLCLQVLVAARRAWSEEGHDLTIGPRSSAFSEAVALFAAEAHLGMRAETTGALS
ncbi:MAG: STAS domain-containing protein [Phenylobacterium sp.]